MDSLAIRAPRRRWNPFAASSTLYVPFWLLTRLVEFYARKDSLCISRHGSPAVSWPALDRILEYKNRFHWLIRAHPELAGRAIVANALTSDSTKEQSGAGLTRCSPEEYKRLVELNDRYNARFGFPFILTVKGYDRAGVIAEFARRVEHDVDVEFAEALRQIARNTRFRVDALLKDCPLTPTD